MLDNLNTEHKGEQNANNVKLAFLEELENSCSVYDACRKLGITRTLVYNDWLKKDMTFKCKYDEIREGHIDAVEGNLIHKAVHDKKAVINQIFTLKTRRSEVYGDRTDSNINVQIDLSQRAIDTISKAKSLIGIEDAQYEVIKPVCIEQAGTEGDKESPVVHTVEQGDETSKHA